MKRPAEETVLAVTAAAIESLRTYADRRNESQDPARLLARYQDLAGALAPKQPASATATSSGAST